MLKIFYPFTLALCCCLLLAPSAFQAQQLHHRYQDLPCINKNYNLLAHVAVDSTDRLPLFSPEDLDTMVMKLNEFFSPICVSFSVCEYNVLEDDYSLGRLADHPITVEEQLLELKNRFTLRRRINVFFLDYIEDEPCGTSTFEGILTLLDANIYVERNCNEELGAQVAHHLGHTFGLLNTFDPETVEFVDGSNCTTTGDLICDTPADPFGQSLIHATQQELELIEAGELNANFYGASCEFVYEVRDPNGDWYQPDMGNIMSAYPCKCGFTNDQYKLMAATILQSNVGHF